MRQHNSTDDYNNEHYILCHHCDLLVETSFDIHENDVFCPRCNALLFKNTKNSLNWVLMYSLCALFMLFLSCLFIFVHISILGVTSNASIFMITKNLFTDNYFSLALILIVFVLFLPFLCLILMTLLCGPFKLGKRTKIRLLSWFIYLRHWCMAEIFLAGVLVSFVKLINYGDIGINESFVPYCLFIFFHLKALSTFDVQEIWEDIGATRYTTKNIEAGKTGIQQNIRLCRHCRAILDADVKCCPRCLHNGKLRDRNEIQWTLALVMTAVMLYIPANFFPIMDTTFLASTSGSTIIDGVIYMWQDGDYPVALIIFGASIIIPILKIISLAWLCYFAISFKKHNQEICFKNNQLYNYINLIGRWSMIDVFVVAVICTLIKNGQFMTIEPNIGASFFAAMVVITIIASEKYDPRLIWDRIK